MTRCFQGRCSLIALRFEELFNPLSAVRKHRTAPLAQEREEFRGFAALLNQIVRFLQLEKLGSVGESEIESAARKWFSSASLISVGPPT
jgi:hypothetical protein